MSQTSQSFVDQLEVAAIGTKKAATALSPPEFKTSQQDKLGDMKSYKRRQKKMEKGLLNQEVEIEEEDYPTAMKRYPMQLDKEEDDGEWITGDPDLPIGWEFKGDPLKKAYKQIKKDRATVTKKGDPTVEGALGELASLFQGITGQELEEEPKVLEPVLLPEEDNIVPFIDPKVIEQGAKQLQELFTDISGMELFGERPQFEEEEVIEIPVTPLETFDISEVISTFDPKKDLNGAAHKVLQDNTYYDSNDFERTQIVQDVDALLEKHRTELPEEQYQILKTDAADKTADYLSKLNLKEFEVPDSMPFTGAPNPLVSSGQFTTAVTGILRKMMATGPGTGVVDLSALDDIDDSTKVDGYVLAYKPNVAPTSQPYKWQSPLTPPVGDITEIIAGTGLTGGGDAGAITIALDTGINATYLANGSVTNTELQYINSLSSNAQTQLDSKPGNSFVTAMAIALG